LEIARVNGIVGLNESATAISRIDCTTGGRFALGIGSNRTAAVSGRALDCASEGIGKGGRYLLGIVLSFGQTRAVVVRIPDIEINLEQGRHHDA
jgi:hypothetical protein